MKVDAKQIIPINVEIEEDEIYRVVRDEILRIYDFPKAEGWYEIRDDKLCRIWFEDYGPYDPDEQKKEIRVATEDDIHACCVLERLLNDYKGHKHAKRY